MLRSCARPPCPDCGADDALVLRASYRDYPPRALRWLARVFPTHLTHVYACAACQRCVPLTTIRPRSLALLPPPCAPRPFADDSATTTPRLHHVDEHSGSSRPAAPAHSPGHGQWWTMRVREDGSAQSGVERPWAARAWRAPNGLWRGSAQPCIVPAWEGGVCAPLARAARGREAIGKRDVTMGQKGSRWAPPLLAAALAVGVPPSDQARTIHPAPAVWRTAALGQPGPAAPGWTRTSVTLRDARGDTEYRWGLVPAGLAPSGAFLDAAVWPTTAMAARHNAQARAEGARGEGGAVLPLLSLGGRATLAPTVWARGYLTPTHCTLLAGETYRNVQFTVALYSDHPPRPCAPERAWLARALRLLWGQADVYGRARRP